MRSINSDVRNNLLIQKWVSSTGPRFRLSMYPDMSVAKEVQENVESIIPEIGVV